MRTKALTDLSDLIIGYTSLYLWCSELKGTSPKLDPSYLNQTQTNLLTPLFLFTGLSSLSYINSSLFRTLLRVFSRTRSNLSILFYSCFIFSSLASISSQPLQLLSVYVCPSVSRSMSVCSCLGSIWFYVKSISGLGQGFPNILGP